MKQIIIKIALLFLVVLVLDRSLGYFFKNEIFEKTISGEDGGNLNYVLKKKHNLDLLILGNSRAKYQIDPKQLLSGNEIKYNAGVSNVGTMIFNDILLDILLNDSIKIKRVLLELDAGSCLRTQKNYYQPSVHMLYPFIRKSKVLDNYLVKLPIEEKIKLYSRLYYFNGRIPNLLANYFKRDQIKDNDGFIALQQTLDTTKKVKPLFNKTTNLYIDTNVLHSIDHIVAMCVSQHIKLAVVFPPYYQNSGYFEKQTDSIKAYLNKRYVNVAVINMADINQFPGLQNAVNWKDLSHLNKIGAAKFSAYLNDSLKARRFDLDSKQ